MNNGVHVQSTSQIRAQYGEHNDCTIWALSSVARISYARALEIGKLAGRRPRRGFYSRAIISKAQELGILKATFLELGIISSIGRQYGYTTYPTLDRFIAAHSTGRYYLATCNHALTLIDGTVYDVGGWTNRRRIKKAWKIELP